jgi:heme A synthase
MLVVNLVIILGGAMVRATGSGAGCGAHWPLCNGTLMPGMDTLHRVIEFSHRASVGVGLLFTVWFWRVARAVPKDVPARRAVNWVVFLTITESLIGAALVLMKLVGTDASLRRAFAMSGHLVNTFLLIGAIVLVAWWSQGRPAIRWRGQGIVGWTLALALGLTLLVGASGAVTALGDAIFPPESRAEIGRAVGGTAHFLKRLRVYHPTLAITAGLLTLGAAWLAATLRPTPAAKNFAYLLGLLFVVQIGLGFLNLFLLAPLALQLAHLLIADAVWICLVLLCASALAEGAPRASLSATRPPQTPKPAPVEGAQ